MSTLQDSWSAFSKKVAKEYLKSFGTPSMESKLILFEVLKDISKGKNFTLVDLGCGNANLAEYLEKKGLNFTYTGVDFSNVLLDAAEEAYPNASFIQDDVNTLKNISAKYDIAVYSHVVEILASPEQSLMAAKEFAKKIVIRFFEPPEFEIDSVELLQMNIGEEKTVPYLRRRMSKDYYRLILTKMDCKQVDVYFDGHKDQVHVLHF